MSEQKTNQDELLARFTERYSGADGEDEYFYPDPEDLHLFAPEEEEEMEGEVEQEEQYQDDGYAQPQQQGGYADPYGYPVQQQGGYDPSGYPIQQGGYADPYPGYPQGGYDQSGYPIQQGAPYVDPYAGYPQQGGYDPYGYPQQGAPYADPYAGYPQQGGYDPYGYPQQGAPYADPYAGYPQQGGYPGGLPIDPITNLPYPGVPSYPPNPGPVPPPPPPTPEDVGFPAEGAAINWIIPRDWKEDTGASSSISAQIQEGVVTAGDIVLMNHPGYPVDYYLVEAWNDQNDGLASMVLGLPYNDETGERTTISMFGNTSQVPRDTRYGVIQLVGNIDQYNLAAGDETEDHEGFYGADDNEFLAAVGGKTNLVQLNRKPLLPTHIPGNSGVSKYQFVQDAQIKGDDSHRYFFKKGQIVSGRQVGDFVEIKSIKGTRLRIPRIYLKKVVSGFNGVDDNEFLAAVGRVQTAKLNLKALVQGGKNNLVRRPTKTVIANSGVSRYEFVKATVITAPNNTKWPFKRGQMVTGRQVGKFVEVSMKGTKIRIPMSYLKAVVKPIPRPGPGPAVNPTDKPTGGKGKGTVIKTFTRPKFTVSPFGLKSTKKQFKWKGKMVTGKYFTKARATQRKLQKQVAKSKGLKGAALRTVTRKK